MPRDADVFVTHCLVVLIEGIERKERERGEKTCRGVVIIRPICEHMPETNPRQRHRYEELVERPAIPMTLECAGF